MDFDSDGAISSSSEDEYASCMLETQDSKGRIKADAKCETQAINPKFYFY